MIEKNLLSFVPKISNIKREFKFKNYESRFDFYVESVCNKKFIIEIKNVPLVDYPKDKMPSFRKFQKEKQIKEMQYFQMDIKEKRNVCITKSFKALKRINEN